MMQVIVHKVSNMGFALVGLPLMYLEATFQSPEVASQHRPCSPPSQLSFLPSWQGLQIRMVLPRTLKAPSSARSLEDMDRHAEVLCSSLQSKRLFSVIPSVALQVTGTPGLGWGCQLPVSAGG